jgi:hypothetical protein
MKDLPFSIYSFTDPETGEVLYVGSSFQPKVRAGQHRSTKPRLRHAKFRIIRVVQSPTDVDRIEAQVIASYKKRGQCPLNSARLLNAYMKPRWGGHSRRNFSRKAPAPVNLRMKIMETDLERFQSIAGDASYADTLLKLMNKWEGKTSAPIV